MNPELERRLRRFGATVDAAAAAKDAQRSIAGREGAPVADLDNVVAIGARPRRTVHALTVAAAVVAIAVAGGVAIALSRSSPSTGTAERPPAPTLAAVVDTTEAAAAAPVESAAPTTTARPASTPPPESSPPATRPTDPPVCRSYEPTNDYHLDICDSGAAVRLVQERLRAEVDSSLKVDGYFGPATRAAVRTFQQMHDLAVDGQVGPATWALLVPDAPGTDTDDNDIVDPDEISTG
jgi:murein L,D-transpeptidase YcbB/YkuD